MLFFKKAIEGAPRKPRGKQPVAPSAPTPPAPEAEPTASAASARLPRVRKPAASMAPPIAPEPAPTTAKVRVKSNSGAATPAAAPAPAPASSATAEPTATGPRVKISTMPREDAALMQERTPAARAARGKAAAPPTPPAPEKTPMASPVPSTHVPPTGSGSLDPLHDAARELVGKNKNISLSQLQRHLKVGYPQAARLMDELLDHNVLQHEKPEAAGIHEVNHPSLWRPVSTRPGNGSAPAESVQPNTVPKNQVPSGSEPDQGGTGQQTSGRRFSANEAIRQKNKLELAHLRHAQSKELRHISGANTQANLTQADKLVRQRRQEAWDRRDKKQAASKAATAAKRAAKQAAQLKAGQDRADGPAFQSQNPNAPSARPSDAFLQALRRNNLVTRPQTRQERQDNRRNGRQQFFTPTFEPKHPSEELGEHENPWLENSARNIMEHHDVSFRPYTFKERLNNRIAENKYNLPRGYYGDQKAILTPRQSPVQVDYNNRAETGLTDKQESAEPRLRAGTMNHVEHGQKTGQRRSSGRHFHIGHRLPWMLREFAR